jgi:hypothetical protein
VLFRGTVSPTSNQSFSFTSSSSLSIRGVELECRNPAH